MRYFSLIILSVFLASCGFNSNSIGEIKLFPVKNDNQYEYVDREGKIMINPQFSEATVFRNGFALVQTSGDKPQWGYIGEDGKYSITANYKSATVFNEEIAWVISENAAPTAIDTKGAVKFTIQDAEEVRIYNEGLAAYSTMTETGETKWGFLDKEGKVKINPQFSIVDKFSDGKCAVKNTDNKWGYIDKEGKITINYQFEDAVSFRNGKAVVRSGGKAGLIDAKGKFLINPQFTEMTNDGDVFLVNQDGKYGWIDKDGKITINPQFGDAYPFSGGKLAAVLSGKNWGYIDKDGKISINPQFDKALPFNGKLALVLSAGKVGFIDMDGKYVINPQFDGVAEDFVYFLCTGKTGYDNVHTDFFNIGAITSKVKFDAPDGIPFKSSISDIKNKYKKSNDDFSKQSSETQLVSQGKILRDVTYDFYLYGGSPWKSEEVQVNTGYYTNNETRYTFMEDFIAKGYAFVINLNGNAGSKSDLIFAALEQSLTGFTKVENTSVESRGVTYRNASNQSVNLIKEGNQIIILMGSEGVAMSQ